MYFYVCNLGTFRGLYDQYYGDSGRDPKIPPYNTEQIINSPTNKAIQKLRSTKTLTKETIETRRKQLDISDCRDNLFKPFISCQNFCLFDLKNDQCETKNIINDTNTGQIVEDLKKQLEKYWHELVPQPHRGSDPRSDPAFCNRTWFPWLDGDKSCILC